MTSAMKENGSVDGASRLERLVRKDQWIIATGLVVICVLSWWFIVDGAGTGMSTLAMTTWEFPPPTAMPMAHEWNPAYWITMVVMWWVMMIAMMTPSAAPTILLYAKIVRTSAASGAGRSTIAPASVFVGGYLLGWLVFSLAATTLQWLLEYLDLVHSMMMWITDQALSAGFLITAGIYQLSPLKGVCLRHCRSPMHFLMRNFRSSVPGAFRTGAEHGLYCVGCCWTLMGLLFVGGIMNLVWIAGLSILVLVEKVLPFGGLFGRISGVVMVLVGAYLAIY